MSAFIWILLGALYLTALFVLGFATLRKGHTILFWFGILFPFLWILGALMQPTAAAVAPKREAALAPDRVVTFRTRTSPDPSGPVAAWTPMDADRARALAETLHRGQRDAGGAPLIEHIRRVAATVAREARVVAWLHEALEHTSISEETLLAQNLSTDELRAIRLVTHDNIAQSNTSYLAHIEMLARAEGAGASLARSVKCADLADRVLHPAVRPDGWAPPYERALDILERRTSRHRLPTALASDTGLSAGRDPERGDP